jgi:hypothetical protein
MLGNLATVARTRRKQHQGLEPAARGISLHLPADLYRVPGDLDFHADAAAGEVNPQAAAEADLMGYRHARRALLPVDGAGQIPTGRRRVARSIRARPGR